MSFTRDQWSMRVLTNIRINLQSNHQKMSRRSYGTGTMANSYCDFRAPAKPSINVVVPSPVTKLAVHTRPLSEEITSVLP